MKKSLSFIIIFLFIIASALHRGGISFQAHLLWTIALLPLLIATYAFRKTSTVPAITLAILLLLLLTILGGWIGSSMRDFGLITMTGLISGITLLLITAQMNPTESEIETLMKYLTYFAGLLSIFGLIIYIFTTVDRVSATFMHLPYLSTSYPNAFALFLLAILPFSLTKLNDTRQLIIASILTTTLLLTFSRGAYITGAIMIALLLFLKKIPRNRRTLTLCGLILLLTLSVQLLRPNSLPSNTFTEKLTLQSDEKTSSVSERFSFWKGALQIIKNHPVEGTGPDTFRFFFPEYQKTLLGNADHPHNFILKHAAEFGIPSSLLLIALIAIIFYRVIPILQNPLPLTIAVSLGAIIIHNLLDYNLNFTSNASLFWLMLGLLIALSPSATAAPRRTTTCITIFLTLTLFIGGSYEIYQRTLIVQARKTPTEKTFQNIKPLFYEDAMLLRAENAIREKRLTEAKKMLVQIISRNVHYARATNLLSEIYLREKNLQKAKKYNDLTIMLDRWNDLRYHYQKLLLAKNNRTAEKFYAKLLKNYLTLLSENAHETVRSDNPLYAIKMATLLEKTTSDRLLKLTFKKLYKDMLATAEREREKFSANFRITLSPLAPL